MSYLPVTLVASANGTTLAVKYLRMPDPPEPAEGGIGGQFVGNPRSSALREWGLQLFSITSGEPGPKIPDLTAAILQDVSLSHDGRYFAVTTGDRSTASTVQVWDLQTSKLLKYWNGDAKIAFAPDRLILAIAEGGVLGLWDLSPLVK